MYFHSVKAAAPTKPTPLRCLIVDDEPQATAALAACLAQAPALVLAGTCTCPREARTLVRQQTVDVLFLSVELPLLAGLALLQAMGPGPKVVLTSTYPDYNLQEYGAYGVVDFLLKPVHAARFQQLAARLSTPYDLPHPPALPASLFAQPQTDSLRYWANEQLVQVQLTEVLYLEDLGGRSRIKTLHQELVVEVAFARLASQLPEPHFLRVNPAFVVALRHATSVAHTSLAVGGRRIAVGAALQEEVLARAFQTSLWGA